MIARPPAMLRTMLRAATILSGCLAAPALSATTLPAPQLLPTGQTITPTAAPGSVFQVLNPGLKDHPDYLAGQAIKTAVSPDGKTLLVLTSGYNNLNYSNNSQASTYGNLEPSNSTEYVFVYDISGANAGTPALRQVLQVPDTFIGLVFSPDGSKFYVSGGADDLIYAYSYGASGWAVSGRVYLGHHAIAGTPDAGGLGFYQSALVGNMALTADGSTLVAVNTYNDTISLIDTASSKVITEYDLRPYNTTPATGSGVAGGESPFSVQVAGTTAYIGSLRDREVVVLNIANPAKPVLVTRIPMTGNPNGMIFDHAASPTKLYVSQDNSDYVAVINLADNTIIEQIDAIAPAGITNPVERYTGANTNNLAISPDGNTLLVTNGMQNAVAVVSLAGAVPHQTVGLIPTGWYPHAVSFSSNGRFIYVVNGKSDPGPNPNNLTGQTYALQGTHYPGGNAAAGSAAYASNEYVLQLEHAGLLSMPVPNATALASLTQTVATNNHYGVAEPAAASRTMAALQQRITHIIYIIKENRTYDQVLGDLSNGSNGVPDLCVFGKRVTPNFHNAAAGFVTFDNFYDASEVSGNGWEWATSGTETDLNTKQIPLDYAASPTPSALNQGYRGAPYEAEGQNRNVDVGIATTAARETAQPQYGAITKRFPGGTANFLPGTNNDAVPDGPNGDAQTGFLWDSALRAGLTVRNYGFNSDLGGAYANVPNPYQLGDIEAYISNPTLAPISDPYYRGFDNNYPDYWRYLEWDREFQNYVTNKDLPSLTLLRLMHDHMGSFSTAVGGINFPEAQQADNDYSVGLVLQAVAHSPYASNTLVFVVEDDAQDGPDHVDAHRSTAYIVGPYVKHHAVDSAHYTQVSMVRTIEDILGIDHLNLNDSNTLPMYTAFDLTQRAWTFNALASPFLNGTVDATAMTKFSDNLAVNPVHTVAWWTAQTRGFDWSREDRVPAGTFNRIIWLGFKGNVPYPLAPNASASLTTDND